jgi:predicted enzyme related to lactoylglutathione lyase
MHFRIVVAGMASAAFLAFAGTGVAGASVAERHEIMALGWYVIFSRPSMTDRMTEFYGQTLGLPMMLNMRGPLQNKNLFWGGEDIVIDVSHHALELPLDPHEADPAGARQMPIFRTDDLPGLIDALHARGATVAPPRATLYGREAFILDPMNRLIGFRQRDANSPFPEDREARRRCARGEAFNPGVGPMPSHVQELGWVRIAVADPAAARRFYGEMLGLKFLGREHGIERFDLGDNTTLEVAPGGMPRPRPAEQRASEAVMILRVMNFSAIRARLEADGVVFPYKIYDMANGGFSYVADSEGNLVGLADRKPPDSYRTSLPVSAEDLEARRRWIEAQQRAKHPETHAPRKESPP